MAFANKYHFGFKDAQKASWDVYFSVDGYEGEVKELTQGVDPVIIRRKPTNREIPLLYGSSVELSIVIDPSDLEGIKESFFVGEYKTAITIKRNGSIVWAGWVKPFLFSYPFVAASPISIKIYGTDHLSDAGPVSISDLYSRLEANNTPLISVYDFLYKILYNIINGNGSVNPFGSETADMVNMIVLDSLETNPAGKTFLDLQVNLSYFFDYDTYTFKNLPEILDSLIYSLGLRVFVEGMNFFVLRIGDVGFDTWDYKQITYDKSTEDYTIIDIPDHDPIQKIGQGYINFVNEFGLVKQGKGIKAIEVQSDLSPANFIFNSLFNSLTGWTVDGSGTATLLGSGTQEDPHYVELKGGDNQYDSTYLATTFYARPVDIKSPLVLRFTVDMRGASDYVVDEYNNTIYVGAMWFAKVTNGSGGYKAFQNGQWINSGATDVKVNMIRKDDQLGNTHHVEVEITPPPQGYESSTNLQIGFVMPRSSPILPADDNVLNVYDFKVGYKLDFKEQYQLQAKVKGYNGEYQKLNEFNLFNNGKFFSNSFFDGDTQDLTKEWISRDQPISQTSGARIDENTLVALLNVFSEKKQMSCSLYNNNISFVNILEEQVNKERFLQTKDEYHVKRAIHNIELLKVDDDIADYFNGFQAWDKFIYEERDITVE